MAKYLITGFKLLLVNLLTALIMVIPYLVLVFFGVLFGAVVLIIFMVIYLVLSLFVGGWLAKTIWGWK